MHQLPRTQENIEDTLRQYHTRALALAAQGQDEAAHREWEMETALAIRAYGKELRAWLLRKVGNPALIGDLFQEVCTWLWRGIPHFRWECDLKIWLFKLAFHVLCHQARSARTHKAGPAELETLRSVHLSAIGMEMSSMGTRLDKRQQLIDCLEQLQEDDRQLILIRQIEEEGASWKDIARIWRAYAPLGDAELEGEAARLRQRFHRAMELLKRAVRDQGLEI